jgi:beta-lactamase class D
MSLLYPNKHSSLKYSIVNISAMILKTLKENSIIEYMELLEYLKYTIGEEIEDMFLLSLSFLYTLKKIEYIKELDSIRLTNETI